MARAWRARQEHGGSMAGACKGHYRKFAGTCQAHARNMTGAWPDHGTSMAGAWQEHGRSMAGAWQAHGKRMAGAWHMSESQELSTIWRGGGLLGDSANVKIPTTVNDFGGTRLLGCQNL